MKLRHLFLKAFGPFTDQTLDFSGPARIHLICGPNEAGKSSALRALADLRYGVHPRSTDNFVHDFKEMLLAGTFEDAAGHVIGLARRKGNKGTLMLADPDTGAPTANTQVSAEVLLALTGGVGREQFETMYGLDSARLREGGRQLIRGEGELGAALFEASTGAAGIKALLGSLDTDARRYFAPRARNTVLNNATEELDEARKRYKLAVTKPEQWKTLKRAHDEARQKLLEVREKLAQLRRRHDEVGQLRVVAPLVQALNKLELEWAQVQHDIELPADARETRLAALQQQAQAQRTLRAIDEAEQASQQAVATLVMEPALLREGAAVDRLVTNAAQVRRDRTRSLQLRTVAEEGERLLLAQAQRLLPQGTPAQSVASCASYQPSEVEHAAWLMAVSRIQDLERALSGEAETLAKAKQKLSGLQADLVPMVDAALHERLSRSLQRALALGNVEQHISTAEQAHRSAQRQLDRDLEALGLNEAAALLRPLRLNPSSIDAYERQRLHWESQARAAQARLEEIQRDLQTQVARANQLSALGEVVSAETLQQARAQRDEVWQTVRQVLVEQSVDTDRAALPHRFEQTSAQADRQADLLREGAQRVAEMAECAHRIADMQTSVQAQQDAQHSLGSDLAMLDAEWYAQLQTQGLPSMDAAGARDWLVLRQNALAHRDQVTEAADELAKLRAQLADAEAELAAVLRVVDPSAPQSTDALPMLITRAQSLLTQIIEGRAAYAQQTKAISALQAEIVEAEEGVRTLSAQAQPVRARLMEACARLHLPADAEPELIKASLHAWRSWDEAKQRYTEQLLQCKQYESAEQALQAEAQALATLLNESVGAHLDAWVDALRERLDAAREAHRQGAEFARQLADQAKQRARANEDAQAAAAQLAKLLRQAGVNTIDELERVERRSDARRAVAQQLALQRAQVTQASQIEPDELRRLLTSMDTVALELERKAAEDEMVQLEAQEHQAINAAHEAQSALNAVDTSDDAAQAREDMESAVARYRAGVRPWAQLRLAEALLSEVLKRHREKAQGPVLALASRYFETMTAGRFVRLLVDADDGNPVLLAQPAQGPAVSLAGLSEGTGDQLYLALRLAALEVQRTPERVMPLVLDDVFMTADDQRASCMFQALESFSNGSQVLVFSHHQHLCEIAQSVLPPSVLQIHRLESARIRPAAA